MAIEKTLTPIDPDAVEVPLNGVATEIEIEIEPSLEQDDGSMIIDFEDAPSGLEAGFGENLAEVMDEADLASLGSELIELFNADRESRADWENTYVTGLDQLGLSIDERTEPWPGACGVFHPLLSEAVVKFQSQAISEIFPAEGPVKTKIVGTIDVEKEQQSHRIQEYMNYLLTEKMVEYRTETEKLLFSLPLAGSAFRKVYFDPTMDRPCAIFVPAEDFVVSYGASDLLTCERATHIMKKTENEIKKLMYSGFFKECDLPAPSPDITEITDKYNKLTGESDTSFDNDNRYTLLEMQVDLDLEGFEDMENGKKTGIALPYIVTLDKSSRKILSIRRNYEENDPKKMRRQHFVHYQYLPGIGFYGFGLIHMIGGLSRSATSLLRQLIDAGTLSNLPGGLKTRGLRIKGDDTPIMPGEFRDVDVPGGSIGENIQFLPYKEPSQTLYSLLTTIVEEGRRFASLGDLKVNDMNNEAPVGTTLAIMERSMKVMSAIQSRLHASMHKEFNILSGIISKFTSPSYPYAEKPDEFVKAKDFDGRVDVIPVSNPNAATMSQRIMQYQAALQLAQQAPEMYDMPELHRQMLEVLGIENVDKVIPNKKDIKPADPVLENMNLVNIVPVKAFEYQDHEAHIAVHMAGMEDPEIQQLVQESPSAQSIMMATEAHIREHLAFQYRKDIEIEMGTPLPALGEEMPPEIEKRLSELVASAADKLSLRKRQEAQQQQRMEQMEDPIIQQRNRELDIQQGESQRKSMADQEKAKLNREKLKADIIKEMAKIESKEKLTGTELGVRIGEALLEAENEEKSTDKKGFADGVKLAIEIQKQIALAKSNSKL
tara:strand:+ start:1738 stop:4227 length:2490 start_codon:yes stop_codon:yes gene_type:complete